MPLAHQPSVQQQTTRGRSTWLSTVVGALVGGLMMLVVTSGCGDEQQSSSTDGSGVSVTDPRDVASFSTVELAGANTVTIHVGPQPSVVVTGDDNLVDRVTTVVEEDRLVIDNTGSFSTTASMRVDVTVPSLDAVDLSGAGTVTVDGITGSEFTAELGGSGTLLVTGTAERSTAVLAGTGTLDLGDLVATDASAELPGTGTIRVNATSTLDASLTGTGTIFYRGDPTVKVHNTGTGTVTPG
jgi:Putative auto-transporter adhesin, head GIN domain